MYTLFLKVKKTTPHCIKIIVMNEIKKFKLEFKLRRK